MPRPCSAEMGEEVFEAEAAEVFGRRRDGFGVDFIDGEEHGFAGAQQEAREIDVGRGELGAAVYDHDDGVGFVESDLGLAVDFGGDEGGVVGDDAAGIDDAGDAAGPVDFTVDAVAGDAGLVAYDGAAGARESVEERGFADVGAADDGEGWRFSGRGLPYTRLFESGFLQGVFPSGRQALTAAWLLLLRFYREWRAMKEFPGKARHSRYPEE